MKPASPIGEASKRSLKVQDVPGLKHSYDPALDIYPKWPESGSYHVSFDIMAQPGADWFPRCATKGEFAAGPYVRWQNGKIAPGLQSGPVPFESRAQPMGACGNHRHLRDCRHADHARQKRHLDRLLHPPGRRRKAHPTFAAKPGWTEAHYLLFSALGTTKTAFFIDNVKLEHAGK